MEIITFSTHSFQDFGATGVFVCEFGHRVDCIVDDDVEAIVWGCVVFDFFCCYGSGHFVISCSFLSCLFLI